MSSDAALQRALKDAQEGRLAGALAAVRVMVRARPRDAAATHVLGMLLEQSGEMAQALHHLARSVEMQPDAPSYRNNYANALLGGGRAAEAVLQWNKALELDPSYINAYLGLSLAHAAAGDTAAAIDAGRKGLAIKGDWPRLAHNLANALEDSGRMDEAYQLLQQVVQQHPGDPVIRSRALQAMNYMDIPPAQVAAAHREYAQCLPRDAAEHRARTDPDPERKLRVGIISGDLRTHSVAYFIEPIISRAPADVSLRVISTGAAREGDPMRARLKDASPEWVDASGVNDATLDRIIRESAIDVLVECGGHTSGGRLTALDRAPAPVIVTAIGYPNTTGHPAVGWRIVDSVTDPQGSEALCTEKLLRLDPCFLCYTPPSHGPAPSMPGSDCGICFGSFNLASKVSARTVGLWRDVLAMVPGSRLILKSKSIADAGMRKALTDRLVAGGIPAGRVECIDYAKDLGDHLACYSRVHIALDTTPYGGTTTTCEALWMGVPVVSLQGDCHASRVGASLLHASGHGEWVARDAREYAAIAAKLAADHGKLGELRSGLRGQLEASALCDGDAYARRFYGALRSAWRTWCAQAV